jgi:hypothetical protein
MPARSTADSDSNAAVADLGMVGPTTRYRHNQSLWGAFGPGEPTNLLQP